MELKIGHGLNKIKFGLHQCDIESMLGKPDKSFTNEEDADELIWQYNEIKLRLTFYLHHGGKLGYIRTTAPNVTFNGHQVIGRQVVELLTAVFDFIQDWEVEDYTFFHSYFSKETGLYSMLITQP